MHKVLLLARSFKLEGGVTNYLDFLVRNLDRKRILIKHFVQGRSPVKWRNIFLPFTMLWQLIEFGFVLSGFKPEIVHINPSLLLRPVLRDGLFFFIARRFGCKILVFYHGWNKSFESNLYGWKLKLFKKIYFKADAIIVLAEEFRDLLRKWNYRGRVYVETTLVDDKCVAAFDAGNKLKAQNQTINLLFLSRVVKEKGIYEALDAYNLIRNRNGDIQLTIAGDGNELSAAKAYVRNRQIKGVRFCGFVEGQEKNKVFREADLFIFPSYYGEGMPTCVLEAMAFGLPVIGRPVGGIKDFFENGKMGYITKSLQPEVLAGLVEKLIHNPDLRRKMARHNRSYAKENFTASRVAKRLETIYTELSRGETRNYTKRPS